MTLFVSSVAADVAESESTMQNPTILMSFSTNSRNVLICSSLVNTLISSYFTAGGRSASRGYPFFTMTRTRICSYERLITVATSIEGNGPPLGILSGLLR